MQNERCYGRRTIKKMWEGINSRFKYCTILWTKSGIFSDKERTDHIFYFHLWTFFCAILSAHNFLPLLLYLSKSHSTLGPLIDFLVQNIWSHYFMANRWGEKWKQWQILFSWFPKSLWMVSSHKIKRPLLFQRKLWQT